MKKITSIVAWVGDLVARGLIAKTEVVQIKGNQAVIKPKTKDRVGFMEDVAKVYGGTPNRVRYNPKGSGSSIGRLELDRLVVFVKPNQNSPTHYEDEQVNRINKQIREISGMGEDSTVLLEHGGKVYEVSGARKVHHKPDPKADIELLGKDRKTPVLWISHKAGHSATDFQNWAGLSERNEREMFNTKPVQAFIKSLQEAYPDGMVAGDLAAYDLQGSADGIRLKYMGVFGNQWGKAYGINNVNWVLQGSINLKTSPKGFVNGVKVYTLTATGHVMVNENKPTITDINSASSPYAPVIMSNYRAGRNNFGVKHSRSGLYPISYKNAKTKAKWLNKK